MQHSRCRKAVSVVYNRAKVIELSPFPGVLE